MESFRPTPSAKSGIMGDTQVPSDAKLAELLESDVMVQDAPLRS